MYYVSEISTEVSMSAQASLLLRLRHKQQSVLRKGCFTQMGAKWVIFNPQEAEG